MYIEYIGKTKFRSKSLFFPGERNHFSLIIGLACTLCNLAIMLNSSMNLFQGDQVPRIFRADLARKAGNVFQSPEFSKIG